MAAVHNDVLWQPEDDHRAKPTLEDGDIYQPDILAVIDATVDSLSSDLRELNLDIHGEVGCAARRCDNTELVATTGCIDHPEIKFEERFVHRLSDSVSYGPD